MTEKPSHGNLEDEETTTDGEEIKGDATTQSSSEDDESDEEPVPAPEPLAPNRLRRANAGSKMHELMGSAAAADEFYESAYGGGFKEDDVDDFAPLENSDDDEVDSDFDQPEDEEEPSATGEDEETVLRRTERQKLLAKNRKWAVARFNKCTVNENACDSKTQKQRLEEAKHTEQLNITSLKRFEEVELERKKRQVKPLRRLGPVGPIVSTVWRADPHPATILIVPEVRQFEKPPRREHRVCAITGRPARYIDPLTGLAYADASSFQKIRETYRSYIHSLSSPFPNSGPLEAAMDTTTSDSNSTLTNSG